MIRYENSFVAAGTGVIVGGIGLSEYRPSSTLASRVGWGTFTAIGGVVTVGGVVNLFFPSAEERLSQRYAQGTLAGGDSMQLTMKTENDIFALARAARRSRTAWRWVELSLGGVFATAAVQTAFEFPKAPPDAYIIYGSAIVGFGSLFALSFLESPAEEMAHSWAKDPSLRHLPSSAPSFTLTPTIGLGSVGFQGTF